MRVLFLAVAGCLFGWLTPVSGQSDAPAHFYDAAIGQTGAPLKSALQAAIRNHTVIPYTATTTDTWDALKVLDRDPINPAMVVLIYSGFTVNKDDQFNGQSGAWDREHLWPQSFGITALNGNSRAKTDLFNLRPIDPAVNSSRGNKYYDTSAVPVSTRPDAPGSSYDSNSWEPRDDQKGQIARSLFYMAVRYDGSDADVPDLELSDTPNATLYRFGKLTTLLDWHRRFPITAAEQARNRTIYTTYQHNRNPFIDHPDYAEMVFLGLPPEEAWEDTHFSDTELATPGIGGVAADPDYDGVSNLLEYVFNGDPWGAESGVIIAESIVVQGTLENVTLTFPHNRNATDVGIAYERSTDLRNWSPISPNQASGVVLDSETEQIALRFSVSAPMVFIRATATH